MFLRTESLTISPLFRNDILHEYRHDAHSRIYWYRTVFSRPALLFEYTVIISGTALRCTAKTEALDE